MTRSLTALLSLLLAFAASAEESKLPADAEGCLECHKAGGDGPAFDAPAFLKGVHAANGIGCTDCHKGYTMGPHDAEGPALSDADKATVAKLAAARVGEKALTTSPRALLACADCHDAPAAALQKSIHSSWLSKPDAGVPGATCVSCHGSPHAVVKLAAYAPVDGKRERVPADRRAIHQRCAACHGNEEFAKAAGLPTEVVARYDDSIHGRAVRVGNEFAPVCTSCHSAKVGGSHGIVSKTDPASSVSEAQKKETCGRCHAGATDNFAKLIAHKEPRTCRDTSSRTSSTWSSRT